MQPSTLSPNLRPWLAAALAFSLHEAAAQEAIEREPIIVTATLAEAALIDLPYSAAQVSAQRIQELQAPSLPDALAQQPGIMLQQTGRGMGSPYIRGFTGFRNLALIDGVRLNNSVFRDGPNQYWNTRRGNGVRGVRTGRMGNR